MGYASYLEDIRDRLSDNLQGLRTSLARTEGSIDIRPHAQSLLTACEQVIADISRHLDMASDPSMDAAAEVFQLREQNSYLLVSIGRLSKENLRLSQDVQQLANCTQELEQENRRHTEDISILQKQNVSVLDRYGAPKRNRRPKPNS